VKRSIGTLAAAALTAAATLMVSALSPADAAQAMVANVIYSPHDLETLEGSAALYHRITSAADDVCRTRDALGVEEGTLAESCAKTVIDATVARINDPILRFVHAGSVPRVDVIVPIGHP